MAEIITLQDELALEPTIRKRCEDRHVQAVAHQTAGFYHWIEAGKLHAANKLEVGSRKWSPWCREHNLSVDSADLLIRIADRFSSMSVSNTRIQIDFGAMQALASPSAPMTAAEEAVKLASGGERITKAEAQRLIFKARQEEAIKAAEEAQAKIDEQLAQAAEDLRQHEFLVATKDREIAELKLAVATAAQSERDKQIAELEGKLVVPEDDLKEEIERLMVPMRAMLAKTEAARDKAIEQRNTANERLKSLRAQRSEEAKAAAERAGKAHLPPFDSNQSLRALSAERAIRSLLEHLVISPAECIAIEIEFSTRMHNRPELAHEKLLQTRTEIEKIMVWFSEFLKVYPGEAKK